MLLEQKFLIDFYHNVYKKVYLGNLVLIMNYTKVGNVLSERTRTFDFRDVSSKLTIVQNLGLLRIGIFEFSKNDKLAQNEMV